jgi:hypothetical protein
MGYLRSGAVYAPRSAYGRDRALEGYGSSWLEGLGAFNTAALRKPTAFIQAKPAGFVTQSAKPSGEAWVDGHGGRGFGRPTDEQIKTYNLQRYTGAMISRQVGPDGHPFEAVWAPWFDPTKSTSIFANLLPVLAIATLPFTAPALLPLLAKGAVGAGKLAVGGVKAIAGAGAKGAKAAVTAAVAKLAPVARGGPETPGVFIGPPAPGSDFIGPPAPTGSTPSFVDQLVAQAANLIGPPAPVLTTGGGEAAPAPASLPADVQTSAPGGGGVPQGVLIAGGLALAVGGLVLLVPRHARARRNPRRRRTHRRRR